MENPEPTLDQPADGDALFVNFVAHRDVNCPRCEYSLRNARTPVCPECGEPLRLSVGLERPIIGALLATVVPCMGCGICGAIFIVLIMLMPGAPGGFVLSTLVMLCSGVIGLVVIVRRRSFIRIQRETQQAWATASIAFNGIVIVVLLLTVVYDR